MEEREKGGTGGSDSYSDTLSSSREDDYLSDGDDDDDGDDVLSSRSEYSSSENDDVDQLSRSKRVKKIDDLVAWICRPQLPALLEGYLRQFFRLVKHNPVFWYPEGLFKKYFLRVYFAIPPTLMHHRYLSLYCFAMHQ